MKKALLLTICVVMISNAAMADHIEIARDETGTLCSIPPGFNTTVAMIHKYSSGATASRFKVVLPGATSLFFFITPYVTLGTLTSDLSIAYGQCISGSFVIGTIIADWGPGVAMVKPSDGLPNILYADCAFRELPAAGGKLFVGNSTVTCDQGVKAHPSTWGSVKALYR